MSNLIINGIDFDKRLDDALELLHDVIDCWWSYHEIELPKENNVCTLIEFYKKNIDQLIGIPSQKNETR